MITPKLALRSLWNRRGTALLTLSAIAISTALLLSVQMLRISAREGFANTLSGADLIVGARSGPINLLLSTVFRVGDASANVSWETYRKIARHRDVAWTIPISLGDTHRGFRVLGTNDSYFEHYQFGGGRALRMASGGRFHDLYDAVLGADVAQSLHYRIGDSIVLSHGLGAVSFVQHKDMPFRVAGILARTGTPVDRTVHVELEAVTAMHIDWRSGAQAPADARVGAERARAMDLTPHDITAFIVGMRSKVMTFTLQRAINEYREEALLAILPGVALSQLWELVGVADTALLVVAAFVVFAGLLGMLTAILTSLNERRREMAILRSVGARPRHIFSLMVLEAGMLATLGVVAGIALTYLALAAAQPVLQDRFGVYIAIRGLSAADLAILGAIVLSGVAIGLIPAVRAYRNTLSDGLQLRV